MKYRLVIFDFDGTLADSFPWFASIVNTLADKHRFRRIEAHEVEALRGASAREIIRRLGIPWWKLPLIGRNLRRLAAQNTAQIALFDGVERMLQQLSSAGVTIALVSSNSYGTVRRVLGPENAARISHYECDVSLFGKPSRFRRVLKRTGIAPQDALSIGDELRDLEAANKARIPFGAVAWGFTQLEALRAHAPNELFAHVGEISERVLGRQ